LRNLARVRAGGWLTFDRIIGEVLSELDGENCALIGAAPFAKSRFALGRLHLI
jgi:hypothetical protein